MRHCTLRRLIARGRGLPARPRGDLDRRPVCFRGDAEGCGSGPVRPPCRTRGRYRRRYARRSAYGFEDAVGARRALSDQARHARPCHRRSSGDEDRDPTVLHRVGVCERRGRDLSGAAIIHSQPQQLLDFPIQHAASRSSERTAGIARYRLAAGPSAPPYAWDRRKLGPCDGSWRRPARRLCEQRTSPPRDDWRAPSARRRCPCQGRWSNPRHRREVRRSSGHRLGDVLDPAAALARSRRRRAPALARLRLGRGERPVRASAATLDVPAITRRTDRGLPRYCRDDTDESDVPYLPASEDLVPVLDDSGEIDDDSE